LRALLLLVLLLLLLVVPVEVPFLAERCCECFCQGPDVPR
jgi:hypothetical protein